MNKDLTRRIFDVSDIDATTPEGQLLMAALAKITTESQTDKTPIEVIDQLNTLAAKMYAESGTQQEKLKEFFNKSGTAEEKKGNRFKTKNIIVEAVQYTGANVQEIIDFAEGMAHKNGGKSDYITAYNTNGSFVMTTGEWLVREPPGILYRYPPELFKKSYEPAD
jgi:hypothetical protein